MQRASSLQRHLIMEGGREGGGVEGKIAAKANSDWELVRHGSVLNLALLVLPRIMRPPELFTTVSPVVVPPPPLPCFCLHLIASV